LHVRKEKLVFHLERSLKTVCFPLSGCLLPKNVFGLYKRTESLEVTHFFFPDYTARFNEKKPSQKPSTGFCQLFGNRATKLRCK